MCRFIWRTAAAAVSDFSFWVGMEEELSFICSPNKPSQSCSDHWFIWWWARSTLHSEFRKLPCLAAVYDKCHTAEAVTNGPEGEQKMNNKPSRRQRIRYLQHSLLLTWHHPESGCHYPNKAKVLVQIEPVYSESPSQSGHTLLLLKTLH